MKYRIGRVSVHQTSKTLGVLYALLGICYVPFMMLTNVGAPAGERIPGLLLWSMPVIMGTLGYVMFALMFALYNWVSGFTGGIEFEFAGHHADPPA